MSNRRSCRSECSGGYGIGSSSTVSESHDELRNHLAGHRPAKKLNLKRFLREINIYNTIYNVG